VPGINLICSYNYQFTPLSRVLREKLTVVTLETKLPFCYAKQNGNYRAPKKPHNAEACAGFHASPCGIYCGQSGTRIGLLWTKWHYDRFTVDKVALGHIYCGQSGTRTVYCGQSGTRIGLLWTKWHYDRFIVDKVALRQVYCGQGGTRTGVLWTKWH